MDVITCIAGEQADSRRRDGGKYCEEANGNGEYGFHDGICRSLAANGMDKMDL